MLLFFFIQLFRRLISEGMTENVEEQILKMSKHLCKINKYRVHFDVAHSEEYDAKGKVLSHNNRVVNYFLEALPMKIIFSVGATQQPSGSSKTEC